MSVHFHMLCEILLQKKLAKQQPNAYRIYLRFQIRYMCVIARKTKRPKQANR